MSADNFLPAFRYRNKNGLLGLWRDVSRDAEPEGDCQDFAWSVLILETGGKMQAIKALLTLRARIWRCWSDKNGAIPRHAVLYLDGYYIDSTIREWRRPVIHRRAWPVGMPVILGIAWAAWWGW